MIHQLPVMLLAATALAVLVARKALFHGTTLVASWWWLTGSLGSLLAIELLLGSEVLDPNSGAAWRFLAATSTVCPGIALLGAKRPQYHGWQWIVGSLWLILALPAIQQLAMHSSTALEVHPARAWFMFGVIFFCSANSLFSRYWLAVLMAGCGQAILFAPFSSIVQMSAAVGQPVGITVFSLAVVVAQIRIGATPPTDPLDRVWLEFRNMFGLVWSLRLMERFNATAEGNGWDVTLFWSGFRNRQGTSPWQLSADQARTARQTLRNLLRRFVSPEWIAARLGNEE
jgi:hypothetical protein